MIDGANIFTVPGTTIRSIPFHKRREARLWFGQEIGAQYRALQVQGKIKNLGDLASRAKIDLALLANLMGGKETHSRATVERLTRLASALVCEFVPRQGGEERECEGSVTLEELLALGIRPTLEPVIEPDQ